MPKKDQPQVISTAGCQKFVLGLVLLIGLCQFAGGLAGFAWATKILKPPLVWQDVALSTLVATLFGSVGVGMLIGVALLRRRVFGLSQNPSASDEPWQARSDWASGIIPASGGATFAAPILAVVALWWTMAITPLLSVLPSLLRLADSHWVWLTLLFPAICLALYAMLGIQFTRARKFGVSTFQMASVPGIVGGQLAGVVRIPATIEAPTGFLTRLTCLEFQKRGRNEAHEVALWQDEHIITKPLPNSEARETALPVLFAIPYDAIQSPRPNLKRDVRWVLDISASLPGVDYSAQFEVPVDKTPDSRRNFRLDENLVADFAAQPDPALPLRSAGILREALPDGVRLVFPAARNWTSALFVTLFVIVFGGLAVFLAPPAWAQIINNFRARDLLYFFAVGLVLPVLAVLFGYVALDLWFYRSVVEASPNRLTVRGGLFGLGGLRMYAADQIRRLTSQENMSSGKNIWKSVVLVPRQGKRRILAKGIQGKSAVEAVINELNTALQL